MWTEWNTLQILILTSFTWKLHITDDLVPSDWLSLLRRNFSHQIFVHSRRCQGVSPTNVQFTTLKLSSPREVRGSMCLISFQEGLWAYGSGITCFGLNTRHYELISPIKILASMKISGIICRASCSANKANHIQTTGAVAQSASEKKWKKVEIKKHPVL